MIINDNGLNKIEYYFLLLITSMQTIYVLRCKENKYYIGSTIRPLQDRVKEHFMLKGSAWTRLYPPIEVIEVIDNADKYDEDKYTKKYMELCGINNVRGGSYVKIKLDTWQLRTLNNEFATSNDVCFRCGRNNHYVAQCHARTHRDGYILQDVDTNINCKDIFSTLWGKLFN
jgi:predicted GIY-YIG superfamily endonuclease